MFNRKWFITTIVTWITVMILDELVYYWWKDLHPDSLYTGVLVKHPLQQPGTPLAGTQQ